MIIPEPEPEMTDQIPETVFESGEMPEVLPRTFEFIVERPETEFVPEIPETLVHESELVDKVEEPLSPPQKPLEHDYDYSELNKKASERILKLRSLSEKLKTHTPIENNLQELENVPAYKRRNVELNEVTLSSESQVARYSLSENQDKSLELKSENSFLHKNVD